MSSFKFNLVVAILLIGFIPVIAHAQSGTTLTYKANEGDILKYESFRQDIRTSERQGESSEFITKRSYNFQLQAEKIDSLLTFVVTVTNFDISSEGGRGRGFQPFDAEAIKGKRVRVTLTPQGEQREISAIDSIPTPARGDRPGRGPRGNPLNQLRINFFQLPARSVKVGDSWTDPYQDINQSGGFFGRFAQDQEVKGKTKFTVLGEENRHGLNCFHIKIESSYSRSFEGEMRGNKMSSESEGETSSEIWFAPQEGILVEYIQDDFSEGTTAFSGRTMPNSDEAKFSLKLIEWKPKK